MPLYKFTCWYFGSILQYIGLFCIIPAALSMKLEITGSRVNFGGLLLAIITVIRKLEAVSYLLMYIYAFDPRVLAETSNYVCLSVSIRCLCTNSHQLL